MSVIKAAQKWAKVPKDFQEKLIHNVFCRNCGVTTIVDYEIKDDNQGLTLEGKCKQCGENVVRFVEGV
ncbi:hypothetical protein [Evansella halocellulosilytica]|uniref:hypothetical protein n=1 Tax=Evansella halocellulosilytica TaxID=2011013 RepID=UPI000BB6FB9E|nr:hypothetical protein [Evansella halocellulosilytica]